MGQLYIAVRQRLKAGKYNPETLKINPTSGELTKGQSVACWITTASSLAFVAGYLLMSPSATSPHPLRALGALGCGSSPSLPRLAGVPPRCRSGSTS